MGFPAAVNQLFLELWSSFLLTYLKVNLNAVDFK